MTAGQVSNIEGSVRVDPGSAREMATLSISWAKFVAKLLTG